MCDRSQAVVSFESAEFGYTRGETVVSIAGRVSLFRGSATVLRGDNGSGKSCILATISGALRPLSGSVLVEAQRDEIAYLPQKPNLPGHVRVRDLLTYSGWLVKSPTAQTDRVAEIAGVGALLNSKVSETSGGEWRRVAIACAPPPPYIGPVSDLDGRTRRRP